MKFSIKKVGFRDYGRVKKLCLKNTDNLKHATSGEKSPYRDLSNFEKFIVGKYRILLVKDGITVGFFYLYPPPSKAPKEVDALALIIDPDLSDEDIVKGGIELLKRAHADYSAVGTKVARAQFWRDMTAHKILDALKLPYEVIGRDPITQTPKIYKCTLPLDLISKRINEREAK